MRVFAVSDIHVDYPENAEWVRRLSRMDYTEDCLILAGDISDSLARMGECFQELRARFKHVFFVPGNHDLWVNRVGPHCSLEKFSVVMELAEDEGLTTQPASIGDYSFVPILSWYDYSFGEPSPYIQMAWMDFKRCVWPKEFEHPKDILQHFLGCNPNGWTPRGTVISYSHFLPRIDLMPSFIPPAKREVYSVLGSDKIDVELRKYGPSMHVYGHSHVNRSVVKDGIVYINNAFGYPNETRIARKSLFNILEEL